MVLLNKRYELEDQVGRGATSTVYRARDIHTGRHVAVKILRGVYSTDPKRILPFQHAANISLSLRHPNIVQVLDSGLDDEHFYTIMELVDGEDLRQYVNNAGSNIAVAEAVRITQNVARGLGFAHSQSIIHGALKPHKILTGHDTSVKVAGFQSYNQFEWWLPRSVIYVSPEQVRRDAISPSSDIYALGTILYELLVGHTPFTGDTPEEVAQQQARARPIKPADCNPSIPATLDRIVMKCLEFAPDERFPDGNELVKALETVW
jgi:eukaryotic-like serine/threonine-protein kinase